MKKIKIATLLLVVAAIFVACSSGKAPPMTFEEVAQEYGDFYSLVYDRSDVKEGSFTLSPAEGDRFRVVVDEPPSISSSTNTLKELSENGERLDITTETHYFLDGTDLATSNVLVRMKVSPKPKDWDYDLARWQAGIRKVNSSDFYDPSGESFEIEIPVTFFIWGQRTWSLEEGLGQALSSLDSGPHAWELEVADPGNWADLFDRVSAIMLQAFYNEGLEIYDYLYSQRLLWDENLAELDGVDWVKSFPSEEKERFLRIYQELSLEVSERIGDFRTWVSHFDTSDLFMPITMSLDVKSIDDVKIKTRD